VTRRRTSAARMALLPPPATTPRITEDVREVLDLEHLVADGLGVARLDELPPLTLDEERLEAMRQRIAARSSQPRTSRGRRP
jgi:hypothetical protein